MGCLRRWVCRCQRKQSRKVKQREAAIESHQGSPYLRACAFACYKHLEGIVFCPSSAFEPLSSVFMSLPHSSSYVWAELGVYMTALFNDLVWTSLRCASSFVSIKLQRPPGVPKAPLRECQIFAFGADYPETPSHFPHL